MYNDLILNHFENPRFGGVFSPDTSHVLILQTKSANGDQLELSLLFSISINELQFNTLIQETRFRAYGGVAVIAIGSFLAEVAVGQTIEKFCEWSGEKLMQNLDLPVNKRASALLAEEVLSQLRIMLKS